MLVVGCWLLVVGCWLLVVGCWLMLVVGCWLLVVVVVVLVLLLLVALVVLAMMCLVLYVGVSGVAVRVSAFSGCLGISFVSSLRCNSGCSPTLQQSKMKVNSAPLLKL